MAAITIPIISDYNAKGVKAAQKSFAQLKSSASRVGQTIKKTMLVAGAAVAGLAAASMSAVKAAIEDQKAQALLARQLKTSTKATKAQVAAVEDQISALSRATGVADDDLRPAFATLVRSTKNLGKSQKALKVALNVSAATGKPLTRVAEAMARAFGGNVMALARLDPSLKGLIDKTTTADEAVALLAKNFDGASAAAADTYQGKLDRLKVAFAELQEGVGEKLLPVVEKFANFVNDTLLPYADELSKAYGDEGFAGVMKKLGKDFDNTQQSTTGWKDALVNIIGTIALVGAALKGAVEFKNFNDLVDSLKKAVTDMGGAWTIFTGVTLKSVLVGLALAFTAIYVLIDALRDPLFREGFGEVLANSAKLIANAFILMYKVIRGGLNPLITLLRLLPGGKKFGYLPDVDFKQFTFDSNRPDFTTPREFESSAMNNVEINVNGGDPNAVIDAIRRYYRQNGPLPVAVQY